MNKKQTNKFSIGVITAGLANIGYQTINNTVGQGEPWTLLIGTIVIILGTTTLIKQKLSPALAGYILIIPTATVSLIGLLLPLTPPPYQWVIPAYYLMTSIMFIGIGYSTYIGIKTILKIT
ncbi:hypothetical protein AMET1_1281 [Methanonatronarchaeum thermophilum]|uniref:Uncharacterized protein n=1 Tax=Methanonatronarchaeum thermophilum TaxID=1927129 RepID=A0A1Y3GAB4_9EURY|nr:hypothetical protein [Methanonatronarchaeum thermophilum]OUJ18368.1 hypothetical protein AMET1_1281 [Methanonatronarchaeum thermophilum]